MPGLSCTKAVAMHILLPVAACHQQQAMDELGSARRAANGVEHTRHEIQAITVASEMTSKPKSCDATMLHAGLLNYQVSTSCHSSGSEVGGFECHTCDSRQSVPGAGNTLQWQRESNIIATIVYLASLLHDKMRIDKPTLKFEQSFKLKGEGRRKSNPEEQN